MNAGDVSVLTCDSFRCGRGVGSALCKPESRKGSDSFNNRLRRGKSSRVFFTCHSATLKPQAPTWTAMIQRTLLQTFVNAPIDQLRCRTYHENELSSDILRKFLGDLQQSRWIGLSPTYLDGKLSILAIAKQDRILCIQFYATKEGRRGSSTTSVGPCSPASRQLLEDHILCLPEARLVAFDMAYLSLLLRSYHNISLVHGIDIQSACHTRDRLPITAVKFAVGDIETYDDNINGAFHDLQHRSDEEIQQVALRAWLSQYLPQQDGMEDRFEVARKIDMTIFKDTQLEFLAKLARDALQLYMGRPTEVAHDMTATWDSKHSHLQTKSNRYKNRLMRQTATQFSVVKIESLNGSYVLSGRTGRVNGQSGTVQTGALLGQSAEVASVVTHGRAGLTSAETKREATILRILQGERVAFENPWIQNIWFPPDTPVWPEQWAVINKCDPLELTLDEKRPLNLSQQSAVQQMLSQEDEARIVVIQGPPGTGKTSVIASFVQEAISSGRQGIWLVAQSNVAVKNIAEKLLAYNFTKWKLLVSAEFHHEWHSHLYTHIATRIIRSDDLPTPRSVSSCLQDCQVMLCTLSMLSSPTLWKSGIAQHIPLKTLIVDEASQIEIGDYLTVFDSYKSIRKMCFIGDDKQLPPFGQEDIDSLQSIFELAHLREHALFLDTQYRMPPQLGRFISKAIYDNKLQSNPLHPIKDSVPACYFIDVNGSKEQFHESSWKNQLECQAVMKLAQQLEVAEWKYRIITPYDAQRDLLEKTMQNQDLQWKDKCFNVDSFQGNEDDYIVISLVRSQELGFLKNLRRTNVMLTRCKHGMFICSSKAFLTKQAGAKSLVGDLLQHCGDDAWLDMRDLEHVIC